MSSTTTTTTLAPPTRRDPSWEEEEEYHSSPTTPSYRCHETFANYRHVMTAASFWLDGVLILVVGIFGLAGNALTVVVLRRIDSNTTFNRLLMSLGEDQARKRLCALIQILAKAAPSAKQVLP